MSRSHLEEDFRLSSRFPDEELRHKVGHYFSYVCPVVVHILLFHSLIFLLQNEFLEQELNKKEQELKLHKAEFDLRRKLFISHWTSLIKEMKLSLKYQILFGFYSE